MKKKSQMGGRGSEDFKMMVGIYWMKLS